MSEPEGPAARLPLAQTALLMRAIGRRLDEIERLIVVPPERFAAEHGDPSRFFTDASGDTELRFAGGLVHALWVWPSQLSICVEGTPLPDDLDAARHRLSATPTAPGWLRECLGQTVRDVRVHVYRDDSPSDEARQAAVSYELESELELFYVIYLHGRLDGDALMRGEDVPRSAVARSISVKEQAWRT